MKSAGRKNWPRARSDTEKIMRIPEGYIVDYRAGEVTRPLDVPFRGQTLRILDSGFRWLHFAPVTENHAITVQLNHQNEPVQIYVDICDGHGLDDNGVPFIHDLYLDVLAVCEVEPDGTWRIAETEIIDVDELNEALADGKITQAQFDLAWTEAEKVVEALEKQTLLAVAIVSKYLNAPA